MAESHLEFTRPAHVVGRYALYGRLAAGGMATVHLGRTLEADGSSRTVAVKRLHPQFCKDPEFVAMFIDEARLAARIKHPNVVETLDILTMGQELLLVMDYIRGECFSKLLRAARRKNLEPSIGVVGRIASGMLHGLHAAHEAKDDQGEPLNVVHRDISPQNVMIDADGAVKVLDFGVAKASARIQITRDGQMKGKLSYMSPEQLQGMPVDRRADVFACGVVLWEALTRRRLFVGEDASEVLRKILRDEVPPPSEFVPGLSPEVDAVVARALCKDPEQRYQTAEELALDIEKIIEPASAREVSEWVHSVAGEILGKREKLLEEIERLGSEGLTLPPADGSSGGSLTDSDTFQRIQSWAEREAARAAELPSHVPSLDAEDTGSALPTVADARCIDLSAPPVSVARADAGNPSDSERGFGERAADSGGFDLDVAVEDGAVEELTSPLLVAEDAGRVPLEFRAPVFSHAAPMLTDSARRRRRWFAIATAAGVFAAMVGITVVAVQPVLLVRTDALRPEAPLSTSEAKAPPVAKAPEAAENRIATLQDSTDRGSDELPIGRVIAPVTQVVGAAEPTAEKAALDGVEPGAGHAEEPGTKGNLAAPEAGFDETSASRVSLALSQPAKERVPPAAKRPARRAPTPPRRSPSRATGAKAAAASAKVDCRQPFWVDDRGIRRLKMACL